MVRHLAHLNVLVDERDYSEFETWYQVIRFFQGPRAMRTLGKATKLRYKGLPDTAKASKPIGEHDRVAEVKSY